MEDIDGGLHPAVDGQSLDEMRWEKSADMYVCRENKVSDVLRDDNRYS